VLGGAPETFMAMQWHRYACELPAGAIELGRNSTCLQAFRLGEAAWGTQFHIEVTREILLSWARWGGDDLAQSGYTQERYMKELDRYLGRHQEIGRDMAERFAEIAATRARSAA
jgi:GMP synthase-like glutamine amidotransferase